MSFLAKLPSDRIREILGALLLALTVFLFFALVSDGYQGNVERQLDSVADVTNLCGRPGAFVATLLYVVLGYASHVLYFLTGVWALMLFGHRPLDRFPLRIVGMSLLAGSVAGLLHLNAASPDIEFPGGMLGAFSGNLLAPLFGHIGSTVIGCTLAVIGILLSTEFLFMRGLRGLQALAAHMLHGALGLYGVIRNEWMDYRKAMNSRRAPFRKAAELLLTSEKKGTKGTKRAEKQSALEPLLDVATGPFAGNAYAGPDLPFPADGRADESEEEEEDDLSRIRVRPEPVQQDIPFDVVPEPETDEASEEVKPRPEPVAKTPRKKPMPRRKTVVEDELPPDYVYPKRYTRPSLDLLETPPPAKGAEHLADALRQTSVVLEKAFATHGIEARVTDVTRGPTITRFELEPAPGIKVNRFTALADDLALALKAHGVRVEAPIPGKGRVGIELPNIDREPVVLRELLESPAFRKQKGKLLLPLGKDISGDVITADLTAMPHLLIAGATGSGKTVCTKAVLASLLFMHSPEELQLVLVDPKMVEFTVFNDIPHLITPVVVDAKKAATALNWLVNEMEERYRLFAQLRVRNIEVYNESVENGEIEIPETEANDADSLEVIRKLPYIVCVIDELADLMLLARAEVEDAIMRLAQLARAVGIHLVIATQRPSVNVLTGVIKANFPVRIAFQVSSKVDSRCILDSMGAERLIGKGDMLYLPAGKAAPTRIQSAFVSDNEMTSLISYLKTQAPPQYRDEIERFGKNADNMEDSLDESDELLDEAIRVVLETGQASISMVQRRLRVGYTRAARLIDMMEMKGIVGPHLGSKAREILVDCAPADSGV